jgi:hypothetical protein
MHKVIDNLATGLANLLKYGLTAFGLLARNQSLVLGYRSRSMYDRPKTEVIAQKQSLQRNKKSL